MGHSRAPATHETGGLRLIPGEEDPLSQSRTTPAIHSSVMFHCAVCSYTTRVRCVRDEDTRRRFRSCTGLQVGSCPALKAKENRKFRSHDSKALVLKISSSTNILYPKLVCKRCPIFTQCKTVLTNCDKPVGQPYSEDRLRIAIDGRPPSEPRHEPSRGDDANVSPK